MPILLDSANSHIWLIALIVANAAKIAPIVLKLEAHRKSMPAAGIDSLNLLETNAGVGRARPRRQVPERSLGH